VCVVGEVSFLNYWQMCVKHHDFNNDDVDKVRTALLAIISFLPTKAEGAIGGIDWSPEERKVLAEK
jgi:ubiquitin-conjugating enzyme E2 J1